MALLIAIGSLTAGVIIGVIATYRFSSTSPVRVRQLEQQIEDLQQTHKAYRENVSTHFSTTAELITQMTESYKDVYRHLAAGAQSLCDHEVAERMLPAGERDRLFRDEAEEEAAREDAPDEGQQTGEPEAPRDYADHNEGSGALSSEDYGLGKPEPETDDDQADRSQQTASETDSTESEPQQAADDTDDQQQSPDTDTTDTRATESAEAETGEKTDGPDSARPGLSGVPGDTETADAEKARR